LPSTRNVDMPGPVPTRINCFSSDDIDLLVRVARLLDKRWKQMPAVIRVAYCTGLRAGNPRELGWDYVDLEVVVMYGLIERLGFASLSEACFDVQGGNLHRWGRS